MISPVGSFLRDSLCSLRLCVILSLFLLTFAT
jgi:hypothetical protein